MGRSRPWSLAHRVSCSRPYWSPSGRNSTYRRVQICRTTSMIRRRLGKGWVVRPVRLVVMQFANGGRTALPTTSQLTVVLMTCVNHISRYCLTVVRVSSTPPTQVTKTHFYEMVPAQCRTRFLNRAKGSKSRRIPNPLAACRADYPPRKYYHDIREPEPGR